MTKSGFRIAALAFVFQILAHPAAAQAPLGTAFTYQGRLKDGGSPASGPHDLRFRLYDAAVAGTQVGTELCVNNVSVTDGLFTVPLDFGAQFAGQERFLEIDARADTGLNCSNPTGFIPLAPRQALTAVPYALYALSGPGSGGSWAVSGINIYNTNTGNVGIGTASPSAKLDVNGTAKMTGFQMPTGAAATKVLMSDAAGVGTWQNEAGLTLPYIGSANVPGGPAFQVTNTAATGSMPGVWGQSDSIQGRGVQGYASAASGTTVGVYGQSNSTSGRGVFGTANNSTTGAGVWGESGSTSGRGVYGWAWAPSGTTTGVYGHVSGSPDGRGVFGLASSATGTTYGLYGQSNSTSGRGVYGTATAATGTTHAGEFVSNSTSGTGVLGWATAATGITLGVSGRCDSVSGTGVSGLANAATGDTNGVYGACASTAGQGVHGKAVASSGSTHGGYFESWSTSGIGARGWATAATGATYGLYGQSDSTSGRGVFGFASASTGTNYGVMGQTNSGAGYGVYGTAPGTGTGVYGYSSSGYGGYFDTGSGTALYVEGTASVGVITIRGGADLAENFEVASQPEQVKPGMVVMIDAEHVGGVTLARGAYNKCVAGVVSGANELQTGMILGQFDGQKETKPVALSGRVWTLVDAGAAGVEPGDLLTTSDTPGHAMAVVDHARAHGATIGKAMSRLGRGEKGLVLVLVNLQ